MQPGCQCRGFAVEMLSRCPTRSLSYIDVVSDVVAEVEASIDLADGRGEGKKPSDHGTG